MSDTPVPTGWPTDVAFHKAPSAYNWAEAIAVTIYISSIAPAYIPRKLLERVTLQSRPKPKRPRLAEDTAETEEGGAH